MLASHTLKIVFAVALSLNLVACGGGGGSGGDTSSGPAPSTSSVNLSWTAPSSRQNGDQLSPSELAGYEIYYFEESSAEADGEILFINNAMATNATINELLPGTYLFAISAIDSNGLKSDLTDYIEAQIE